MRCSLVATPTPASATALSAVSWRESEVTRRRSPPPRAAPLSSVDKAADVPSELEEFHLDVQEVRDVRRMLGGSLVLAEGLDQVLYSELAIKPSLCPGAAAGLVHKAGESAAARQAASSCPELS